MAQSEALKQRARERALEYYKNNKEEVKRKAKIFREKNKEKKRAADKAYYERNKEAIKEKKKEYEKRPERRAKQKEYRDRPENKEKQNAYIKMYYEDNRERLLEQNKEYMAKHKEEKREYDKEYRKQNEDKIRVRRENSKEYTKEFYLNRKIQAYNILGGCKCAICGEITLEFLTIDHIDQTGSIDRKGKHVDVKNLHKDIVENNLTPKELLNLRVLCWNHNCERFREYLDLPREKQSYQQRHQTKLWKEALDFFGPCHCGNTDLKHLTISHIHNDGAERRRNGEKVGNALLLEFRKQGWPQSLKEDFCLECWNHNSSRKY